MASFGLRLLVQEDVVVRRNGRVLDKSKLPPAAFKYLTGESITGADGDWVLKLVQVCVENGFEDVGAPNERQ